VSLFIGVFYYRSDLLCTIIFSTI